MGRYDPLRDHLARQPDAVTELAMSFHGIEQLVGPLPKAASRGEAWWHSTFDGTVQQNGKTTHWGVAHVGHANRTVVFSRGSAARPRGPAGAGRTVIPRRALVADLLIGGVAALVSGVTAVLGLSHLPLLAIALLSFTIGGLSFAITQALNSRKTAATSRVWWAFSTVLATAMCAGALVYHAWLDPATHPPALPFTISVRVDPPTVVDWTCRPIVRPGSWHHVPLPPEPLTPPNISTWFDSQHAVDGKYTAVVLELQGRSQQATIVDQPLIAVRSRQAPLRGAVAELSGGCGGIAPHRLFAVDLDQQDPVVHMINGAPYPDLERKNGLVPQISAPSFTISAGDPEYFVILASTAHCFCRWSVELPWSSGGQGGTVTINDGTRPFATTAEGAGPRHFLLLGKWS